MHQPDGINRPFRIDGYFLCDEVCERALGHEIVEHRLPISQLCCAGFPKFEKYYWMERNVHLPFSERYGNEDFYTFAERYITNY